MNQSIEVGLWVVVFKEIVPGTSREKSLTGNMQANEVEAFHARQTENKEAQII